MIMNNAETTILRNGQTPNCFTLMVHHALPYSTYYLQLEAQDDHVRKNVRHITKQANDKLSWVLPMVALVPIYFAFQN